MNTKLLLIAISAVTLCSCSSVYKTGQTPDDVYFSPVRAGYDEARRDEQQREDDRYTTLEDRQIRMGINNRRWRWLDDDYSYNYNYGYSYNYNPYNYGYNGYYYNPFYCTAPVYSPVIIVNNPKNTTPRKVNLASYGNGYSNTNTAVKPKNTYSSRPAARTYNNSNTNNGTSGLGNVLGKIFSSGNNNNSNNSSSSGNSNRTYTPSSSSSSGGKSSSSGGGSVSRPSRNGKG
ncbi:MAG: hypothetical protein QM791_05760 [Ferruginibacter sp.]